MTPDDVRAAAERLINFHERFAPLIGTAGRSVSVYLLFG